MQEDEIDHFWNQVKGLYQRVRREQPAIEGMSRTALHVLTVADNARTPMRPSELADELQMMSPNMAAALRSLEEHGLVKSRPDPADGRQKFIDVTDLGHRLVAENRETRHTWLRNAIERSLTAQERDLLFQAGEIMQQLAGDRRHRHVIRMPEPSRQQTGQAGMDHSHGLEDAGS